MGEGGVASTMFCRSVEILAVGAAGGALGGGGGVAAGCDGGCVGLGAWAGAGAGTVGVGPGSEFFLPFAAGSSGGCPVPGVDGGALGFAVLVPSFFPLGSGVGGG